MGGQPLPLAGPVSVRDLLYDRLPLLNRHQTRLALYSCRRRRVQDSAPALITRPERHRVKVSALPHKFLVVSRCDAHASRRARNSDENRSN